MKLTPEQKLMEPRYFAEAQAYLRALPPEHFMEATSQATQRKITVTSMALVHSRRPEVQCFNELLVQYPRPNTRKLGQVVPDNMVVVWHEPIEAGGSYDVPLQPVKPFWVLEYVSKSNTRKDYERNITLYEQLGVPYYLIFYPDTQDLTLRRLNAEGRYVGVLEDPRGRLAIPELELEVALLDEWARFWFRGELLPLPEDWLDALDQAQYAEAEAKKEAERFRQQAEAERQKAEAERQKAEAQGQALVAERQKAEALAERIRQLEALLGAPPSPGA